MQSIYLPPKPQLLSECSLSDRILCLEGSINLRALGGYKSHVYSSLRTRDGYIYRSGMTDDILCSGWAQMASNLGISTIIDLRLPTESGHTTSVSRTAAAKFEYHNIPMLDSQLSLVDRFQVYWDEANFTTETLSEAYLRTMEVCTEQVKEIIHTIRDRPGKGILIHCSLGKDRTGIICAILLSLAGVADIVIAEDYALSEAALREQNQKIARGIDRLLPGVANKEQAIKNIIQTEEETMLLTLSKVHSRFGGINEYLKGQCGIADGDIRIVQSHLLVQDESSNNLF